MSESRLPQEATGLENVNHARGLAASSLLVNTAQRRTESVLRMNLEKVTLGRSTGTDRGALQGSSRRKLMALQQDAPSIERRTIAKVSWRLLPLVAVAYCIAYIDRSNISVAALTMNKDLGFSAYIYGWGAGIFFFSYFLFEIPSNLVLEKVGARIWIARIMITWGIISGLTAFVTGTTSFLIVCFLLGAAQAGFFPGMILYFTYWFPSEYRGRVISTLFIAQPVANAVASIASAAVLEMDGVLGIKGWQWIFIIEALPAVLLAFVVLMVMTDKPALAGWLAPDEKTWLQTRIDRENRQVERTGGRLSLLRALSASRR